ncbi:MAG TPA: alkaline phosphatase family protein [Puia sp.]|jgi:YVTN family beta-propeller protein|nr:alkaline phosphatase family protein [Puia sp.]
MKNPIGFIAAIILVPVIALAQKAITMKLPFEQDVLKSSGSFTVMPYNRLIKSAGKVIRYGDSSLENHALDLCVLPDKKHVVIEDRFGIAIVQIRTASMIARWSFNKEKEKQGLLSTYSGITSFEFEGKIFIAWGANTAGNGQSAIMVAEWSGKKIESVTAIPVKKIDPSDKALPNQIVANTEDGILYLYAVLNGNDQLVKIKFDDKSVVWSAQTGVAPYGLSIIQNKAYVTNWAGPLVTDTTLENAGTPWGSAYTDPRTGGTNSGSLSVMDITNGKLLNELALGLHPSAIIKSGDNKFLYIANGNSDFVSVVDVQMEKVVDSIETGLFSKHYRFYGSSPDALFIDASTNTLYVANSMDNAVAVIQLGKNNTSKSQVNTRIKGYIPTEAYPSGIVLINHHLFVTNLEAKGSRVLSASPEFKDANGKTINAFTIHKELTSLSIIPLPDQNQLNSYTAAVKKLNLFYRTALSNGVPRTNILPKPMPERIGEPSVFKHVVYIIKENKTYDQVFGDMPQGRGDKNLCIYGEEITPNQHKLATDFCLLDNYYASGKSSGEGHQWVDASMVSDYIERNVRAWFRSYPHRQTDALVYNKNGFIWNNAMDHGKKVRIYGEACLTHYDTKMKWLDIYNKYLNHEPLHLTNTSTIARIRPIISPDYPDCDNISLTDQIRADVFISDWKKFEQGDSLPDLMVLSIPNDHTAGTSPNFPTPRAMVADNDLALGRIIETITRSRFWDSTVIFVSEDDSQSGWDHISPYRTTCEVISPFSNLGKTIHTNYNQTSMVRSIEQILGIPPMNVIDATALPMFDCFGSKKQSYNYQLIANTIPLNEMNKPLAQLSGKARFYAKLSASKAFKDVDGGEDDLMNRILWFNAKGDKKYPVSK